MKIQNLAVMFIVIILPISMVLTAYVQNQTQTLSLQIDYDDKLKNATYDALKAFQLNTANSSTSDLANSKLRDIEASVNTFFNSISSHFNMAGYNKDILKEYVPALVYTMYDGYYIYSPYTNTLTKEDFSADSTYQNNVKVSGLKPYIYYSCRYQTSTMDVIISYSLDNYITVRGKINGNSINESGYLINDCDGDGTTAKYRGITIGTERLEENVMYETGDTGPKEYVYTQENGVKYYYDSSNGTWFSVINGERITQTVHEQENNLAIQYYTEAAEFKNFMQSSGLINLRTTDAVDESGVKFTTKGDNRFGNYEIFTYNNGNVAIEEPNSNFNQHRLAVIRYSIEKNLSIAIANYNNYSDKSTNFQMPTLQEDEWEKIINNVSIISFMQGLSIGGKIYNGYSIVTNTKNKEVVSEDSIYIVTNDGTYHRATDSDLINNNTITQGVFNMDFERKSVFINPYNYYYYPKTQTGCYNSIVNYSTEISEYTNIYDYLTEDMGGYTKEQKETLAKIYFTALGRERQGMYRTNNVVSVYIN